MKIAVLMFPGMNCEHETKDALEQAGMQADILLAHEPFNTDEYAGYVIPGGFSYEDRVRGGVIASLQPVVETLKKEAAAGKPILGICNGAQVLVETGMVPGRVADKEVALAPNHNPFVSGYYCTWTYLKKTKHCAFTLLMQETDVLAIPVAHGEGRFVAADTTDWPAALLYCTKDGEVDENYPITPNGSYNATAALCNEAGNVMALMPHPERSSWPHQFPTHVDQSKVVNGQIILQSMKHYIEARL